MLHARSWLVLAALNGLIAVAAGAFAAHSLKGKLSAEMMGIFETAARYQMYHALALLAVAWLASTSLGDRSPHRAGWCFLTGIVLFSGSLYFLAVSGWTRLGMVTPLGGVCFLAGWTLLAWAGWRR